MCCQQDLGRAQLIYASMPLVFDILNASSGSVVVVITPLTPIMKDQVILPNNATYVVVQV